MQVLFFCQSYDIIDISETGEICSITGALVWKTISCPGELGRAGNVEVLLCM